MLRVAVEIRPRLSIVRSSRATSLPLSKEAMSRSVTRAVF